MALAQLARRLAWPAVVILPWCLATPSRAQTAHVLNGAGPVNNSIGGASTALPLDASGALYWNPATVSGLRQSEADIGFETLFPHSRLSSTYAAGVFGPLGPSTAVSGTSSSDGFVPIPNFAVAWKPEDSPLSFGVAAVGLAGFSLDYGVNPANPITSAQPPHGMGFGSIYVDYQVLQVTPAAAYQINDHWSVGGGPILDVASLAADPFPFVTPDDANGDGFATYPSAVRKAYSVGAGFQAGVYYNGPQGIHWGFCFKSPQWFDSFHLRSQDELGRARSLIFNFDFPMVLTTGVAYTGVEHFQFALDFRFIDYKDTTGFKDTGFSPQGVLRGLGWDNVFVTALGVQYAPGGPWSFRVGYSYNNNPIPAINTGFNLASPSINEHTFYCGFSYQMAESWLISLMYGHGFTNELHGPLQIPGGPVPGTVLRSEAGADSLVTGVSILF
jgi:long-chain fatty acid transport protein